MTRLWLALNIAVTGAAFYYAVLFLYGNTEGAFAGRRQADWRAAPAITTAADIAADIAADMAAAPHLMTRAAPDGSVELLLILPRAQWLLLRQACVLDAAPAICFSGARLDHRARLSALPRNGRLALRLDYRDGTAQTVYFLAVTPDA